LSKNPGNTLYFSAKSYLSIKVPVKKKKKNKEKEEQREGDTRGNKDKL
jgi:hypothetical protein